MSRIRWGDALDDEDVLPEGGTVGPNDKGIIIKTEYYHNGKGEPMKKTTKIQLVKVQTKVFEVTAERKQWALFGLAAKDNQGVTMQSPDEIMFEQTNKPKKQESKKDAIANAADKSMAGRSLTDILAEKRREREMQRAKGLLPDAEAPPGEGEAPRPLPGMPGEKKGNVYVPPSRKAGASGMGMMPDRRDQDHSLRVSNLSENVSEQDLKELFGNFGDIARVYVAYNRETNEHRGFAFVNFRHAFDAEKAMAKLDGYGYENMILRVELAAPREPR